MSYIEWIRKRVGTRKIFLVFSSVVLWDEYGRVLLQHRTDFDVWGLPGGVLEINEDIEMCTRRELLEETGLTAGDLSLVGVYTHPKFDVTYPNGDRVQPFTICFAGQVSGGQARVDGTETAALGFFEAKELNELDIPIWYQAMLHDVRRGGPPAFTKPFAAVSTMDQIRDIRPFIGTERLIAPGAVAVVARDDGRILMTRRVDDGEWDFPAGFSDLGENVAHTAVREVKEETGYDIQVERIIGVFSHPLFHYTYPNGDRVKNVGVLFRVRLVGGRPKLDVAELLEIAWMTPDEIAACVPDKIGRLYTATIAHLDDGYFVD
ncbi:MAG: NUDIX domain-containing protein [Chloroflexi bacterium]|nr:NUDIX domain-containing protein [Chloroflexota bacterium]